VIDKYSRWHGGGRHNRLHGGFKAFLSDQ